MGLSLRNIGKKIGDVLGGVERQINPFDHGATYSNPRPAPAPRTTTPVRRTPTPTRAAYNPGFQGGGYNPNRAVTPAFAPKKRPNMFATPAQEQKQADPNPLVHFITDHTVKPVTDMVKGQVDAVENSVAANSIRLGAANLTHNDKARTNAKVRLKQSVNNLAPPPAKIKDKHGKLVDNPANDEYYANIAMGATGGMKAIGPKSAVKAVAEKPKVAPKVNVTVKERPVKVDPGNLTSKRNQFGEAMVDKDTVLINLMKRIEKQTGKTGLRQGFLYNSSMLRSAPAIASHVFRKDADINTAIGGLSRRNYRDFTNYATARRELANARDGLPTSAPVADLEATVAAGHDAFNGRFQGLNNYYKKLAEEAHRNGLIDADTLKHYASDGDYIRLQRDMGDLETRQTQGKSYSLGSTTTRLKRSGSKRAALDPVHTALDYTKKIYTEIGRNKTAEHLLTTLHDAGISRQLINADNVAARRAAFQALHELKPVRVGLQKQVTKATKRIKELSKRNEQLGPEVLDKIQSGGKEIRDNSVRLANGKLQGSGKKLSRLPSEADINEAFQEFLDGNPALVKKMYEFMGNKSEHARVTKELEALKKQYDDVKRESRHQWLTGKAHGDLPHKNLNTISFLRNGYREMHEVPAEVKRVMDQIAPYQLNGVERVVGAPARVLRAGATALNPVFTASNIVKDQIGSAVISPHAASTHTVPKIASGIKQSGGHFFGGNGDALWNEYIKRGGDLTQFDLNRNIKNTREIVDRVRGGRKVGLKNALTHPIRTLEDANSITEKATRFQNFKGIYQHSIKEGKTHEAALQDATMAALEHTVNFNRAGSWGRIINLIFPYSNAAIQGGRQLAVSAKAHPFKTATKGFAWVGTPIAAATVWNLADEERKKVYDNISDYEKQNNLVLIRPGTKYNDVDGGSYGVVKIPLPPDIGTIFQSVRQGIEAAKGDNPINAGELASDVTKPFVGPLDLSSKNGFVSSVTPQALKPVVNQAANRDFYTGKQIVPDYLKDQMTHPEDRVNDHTSSVARKVGKKFHVEPVRVDKAATDIAGKVGSYSVNAADTILSKLNKSEKDDKGKNIVGGESIPTAYGRRFFRASAKEDPNNEAAKHFKKVDNYTKGFNANDMAAWKTIHPNKVDGDSPDKTFYDAALRGSIYLKNPKVLEADNKINKGSGQPFYELPPAQQKIVLQLNTLSDDPGSATAKKITKDNPWLSDYYDAQSAFFDNLASSGKIKDSGGKKLPTPPKASARTQNLLNQYGTITDGTEKADFLNAHPDVSEFFEQSDNYQRTKRDALQLPQFDRYPKPSGALQAKLDVYNSLPKHDGKRGGNASRYKYIQANPEIADYFNAVSLYALGKDAELAQFEGEDWSDKTKEKLDGSSSSSSSSGFSYGYGYGSRGGHNGGSYNPFANTYDNVVKFSGKTKSATVTPHLSELPKPKVSAKGSGKPKVTVKKSKV